jgi:hypothetical protein
MYILLVTLLLVAYIGPHNSQIEGVRSKKGLYCCNIADGHRADEWGMQGANYWVVIEGKRYDVPDDANVDSQVRVGASIVWYYIDTEGKPVIKCFLPGPES